MRSTASYILVLFAISFVLIPFLSCKKAAGPAECVITVVDSTGKRIANALVILHQDSVVNSTNGSQAVIREEGTTDAVGTVHFSFKLEAVLNVDASKGTRSGKDFIRLERSETVSKSVVIR
jgi:hypothetical protein